MATAPVISKPAPAFLSAFYKNVLPNDLALFSPAEKEKIAASIWTLAQNRKPNETKLRVFNPEIKENGWTVGHTVVEIVHKDMPFLVDSITGTLQSMGLAVHIIFHPVCIIERDHQHANPQIKEAESAKAKAESLMHIQTDHIIEPEKLKEVEAALRATLKDVEAAVQDWQPMRERAKEHSSRIKSSANEEENKEASALLEWLLDDNFTFLGYREIEIKTTKSGDPAIAVQDNSGLGILRDPNVRMFGGLRDYNEQNSAAMRKYAQRKKTIYITKTHAITKVHRILPMDAIFVRQWDEAKGIIKESLFVGLFTARTYAQTPKDIPIVRKKVEHVISRLNFPPKSYNSRNLSHILNTYPHDELFQIGENELHDNTLGILQLQERARVAIFPRRDPFDQYVTFLVYVPREIYDSALREKILRFLEKSYAGKVLVWNARIDESRLACMFASIRLHPKSQHPEPHSLNEDLRELCRTWSGRLRDSLVQSYGEAEALNLLRSYGTAFPESYREAVTPNNAVKDIKNLEKLSNSKKLIADITSVDKGLMRLKLLQRERPLLLSESLPIIENMGLKIDYMGGPYEIRTEDADCPSYIHEFVGRPATGQNFDAQQIKESFETALVMACYGEVENDPFNALTLRAGMDWRAITVMRAFARYLRQLRIPYSHEMMAETFLNHPEAAQKIFDLFIARHDPDLKSNRQKKQEEIETELFEMLSNVNALEDDRTIRRYINLVQSSLRTNYFQTGSDGKPAPYLSIKFDSRAVDFMPLPKPLYEIFVYSPSMEAVHLRGGKVARGGIRWSDRRDDFRAEILGLMKAQMVKNTVIVPVGSKGGFIVKRPPAEADKMQEEGISCYKAMMRGMLDITDNSKNGKIIPPARVVRHDEDDPYLVVAADKGTAKFSDIANGIAREYDFWLDDAFASGGSAGYDHKGMGITARGAWEAVKRHFREMDKDIQNEDFTCIGVGDMSGDVFGNGMLLSKHTRLIGAFDHRHIFCDPSPDTAKSYAERKRMFSLPRSSWNDYDRKAISKGGGIFSRSEKIIKLSPEMKAAYGVIVDSLSPAELIQAMLKADTELLYFGGIGTYVKASYETHDEVGDRINEGLRIDACELKAKVISEGANLGMTQKGRIEYAQNGGRINTDAIDNSAGVDTSDHEVNIKILLRRAVDAKKLTMPARDKLLAQMTDEVAELVLRDNYLQTQALSIAQFRAPELLPLHERCMQIMEKDGLLNRSVEYLPNSAETAERLQKHKGFTRPEIAVLKAYAKIWVYNQLIETSLPDDPFLKPSIIEYFPKALREKHAKDVQQHRLRREIAATVAVNDIINHTGSGIICLMDEAGDAESLARAYFYACEAFSLRTLWNDIENLDNKIPATAQIVMFSSLQSALSSIMAKIARDKSAIADIKTNSATAKKEIAHLAAWIAKHRPQETEEAVKTLQDLGVSENIATRVALMPMLAKTFDLISLSARHKLRIEAAAEIFFGLER